MLLDTVEELPLRVAGRDATVAAKLRHRSEDWVVLLHGLGCAKESFDGAFQAAALERYSLCAIDFPGHGSSARLSAADYSLPTYAQVVEQVVRHLAPQRLFMVGHSMGGAVGLIAAKRLAQLLRAFVSIEGNLVSEDCGLVSRQAAAQSAEEFARTGFQSFVAGLRRVRARDYEAWADWCEASDPLAIHGAARSLVQWSDSGDLMTIFRRLPYRAYCYGTEGDDRVSHLFPKLAGIPQYHIARSGHFPMVDNPDDLYRTLGEILAAAIAHQVNDHPGPA